MLFRSGSPDTVWAKSRALLRVGDFVPVKLSGGVSEVPVTMAVTCRVGAQFQILALVDTGAAYTVLSDDLAATLREENVLGSSLESLTLSTRHGSVKCNLHQLELVIVADGGRDLHIDATCAVPEPEQWEGPTVIGFYTVLESLRFAVEVQQSPGEPSWLYFDAAG